MTINLFILFMKYQNFKSLNKSFNSPKGQISISFNYENQSHSSLNNSQQIFTQKLNSSLPQSNFKIQTNRNIPWNLHPTQHQRIVVSQDMQIKHQNEILRKKYEQLLNEHHALKKDSEKILQLKKKVDTFEYERNQLAKYIEHNNLMKQNQQNLTINKSENSEKEIQLQSKLKQVEQEKQKLQNEIVEIQQFSLERQNQIKQKYEQYINHIRKENNQLIQINKQYENQVKILINQFNKTNQPNNETQINREIDRMSSIIKNKDKQLNNLINRINELQQQLRQKNQHDTEFQLKNNENRIQILQLEIERCNTTILNKNKQIFELKNLNLESEKISKLNMEIKSYKFEIERLNQLIQQKNSEINVNKNTIFQLQRKLNNTKNQNKNSEFEDSKEIMRKYQLEINRLKQILLHKQNYVNQIQYDRKQEINRNIELQNLIDHERQQTRNKINQLQRKIIDYQTIQENFDIEKAEFNAKLAQKQNILKLQRENKQSLQEIQSQLKYYKSKFNQISAENDRLSAQYEDKFAIHQKIKQQLQQRITQICNLNEKNEIEIKNLKTNKQIKVETQRLGDLEQQIGKLKNENELIRNQYEKNIKKYRLECEKSHVQALKQYENKIGYLEKELMKKISKDKKSYQNISHYSDKSYREAQLKNLKKQNSKLKKILAECSLKLSTYQNMHKSLYQLQHKVKQFQYRVLGLVQKNKTINQYPQQVYNSPELKDIISDINMKMKKFKSQNQKLKTKLEKNKQIQEKLMEYENQNERLISNYENYQQKIQRLGIEIIRLKQIIYEYQMLLDNNQNNHANHQKIRHIEQQSIFYKNQNSQLESRVNQLLQINRQLKFQLLKITQSESVNYQKLYEQAQQKISNHMTELSRIEEQCNQQKNNQINRIQDKYQQQLLKYEQQINYIKQNHKSILQQQRIKILDLESKIFELNMKLSAIKTQMSTIQSEKKQIEIKNEELVLNIQDIERRLKILNELQSNGLEDKMKITQVESINLELNLKLSANKNEISYLQSQLKKYQLQINQLQLKLNQNSQNNKFYQLQQEKQKVRQLQQHLYQLNSSLLALNNQKYLILQQNQQNKQKLELYIFEYQKLQKHYNIDQRLLAYQNQIIERDKNRLLLLQKIIVLSQQVQRLKNISDQNLVNTQNEQTQRLKLNFTNAQNKILQLSTKISNFSEISNLYRLAKAHLEEINYYVPFILINMDEAEMLVSQIKFQPKSNELFEQISNNLIRSKNMLRILQNSQLKVNLKKEQQIVISNRLI